MTSAPLSLERLPGGDYIADGLADALAHRETASSCLLSMALPRLYRSGLIAPGQIEPIPDPELCLYRLLRKEPGDAFSRYQALHRRLVRFEHALDHHLARHCSTLNAQLSTSP